MTSNWGLRPALPQMIRVLVADDNDTFLEGLVALAERHPRLAVVGTAGNGADAVQLAAALEPDVVVLDVLMPGLGGIDAAALIRAGAPDVAIVVLSALDDRATAARALRAGADAFLTKHEAIDGLGETLVETALRRRPPGRVARADAADVPPGDPAAP